MPKHVCAFGDWQLYILDPVYFYNIVGIWVKLYNKAPLVSIG